MDRETSQHTQLMQADTETGAQVLEQIRNLKTMTIFELKQKWCEVLSSDVPPFAKRGLLTQVLPWELQAKISGGISTTLHRHLMALGKRRNEASKRVEQLQSPILPPGVKLLRVWKGVTHHVMVTADGFEWQHRSWKSLSAIARKITGTPWSGPVFFGLRKSKKKLIAEARVLIDG